MAPLSFKKAMEKKLLSDAEIKRLAAAGLAMSDTTKVRHPPAPSHHAA
jgi:hypothetical protein